MGDWIYYKDHNYDNGSLYRIRVDGTGNTRVIDSACFAYSVVGDWVYYSGNSGESDLWKIRTDGTGNQRLLENRAIFDGYRQLRFDGINFDVAGDWIYILAREGGAHIDSPYGHYGIYKVRTDGTGGAWLIETKANTTSELTISGGWIYYSLFDEDDKISLYRVRLDGTGNTKLAEGIGMGHVVGDLIIFGDPDRGGVLLKMKTDGTGRQEFHRNQ